MIQPGIVVFGIAFLYCCFFPFSADTKRIVFISVAKGLGNPAESTK